ncbi:MAG: glycoside hydrolase family 6 protein, partial [Solirubrobacterales bacterium]|nr:glycoside hydrolase family 6 protein [Solirubrobacterales bacterium]
MNARLAALTTLIIVCLLGVSAGLAVSAGAKGRVAGAASACSDAQYPATRDPSNPLMLPQSPGADPLAGASLFVDGPRHGAAAGEIAKLLGMDPKNFPDSESWNEFDSRVVPGALKSHPQAAFKVHMLEKIAREPETQRLSEFTGGGGPGALFAETQKLLCNNLQADQGSIPVFNTLFALPHGKYCASRRTISANGGTFKRQVSEVARATGRRPVIFLLELDGVATSQCLSRAARHVWERQVRFEVDKLASLPHTVVYMEAGYSDANSARYTAKVLNALGIGKIRGFYTNDTHL